MANLDDRIYGSEQQSPTIVHRPMNPPSQQAMARDTVSYHQPFTLPDPETPRMSFNCPPTGDDPSMPAIGQRYNNEIAKSKSHKARLPQNRTRVTQACDYCNMLRSKCTGLQPCKRCQGSNRQCQYNRMPRKRGRASAKLFSSSSTTATILPKTEAAGPAINKSQDALASRDTNASENIPLHQQNIHSEPSSHNETPNCLVAVNDPALLLPLDCRLVQVEIEDKIYYSPTKVYYNASKSFSDQQIDAKTEHVDSAYAISTGSSTYCAETSIDESFASVNTPSQQECLQDYRQCFHPADQIQTFVWFDGVNYQWFCTELAYNETILSGKEGVK